MEQTWHFALFYLSVFYSELYLTRLEKEGLLLLTMVVYRNPAGL